MDAAATEKTAHSGEVALAETLAALTAPTPGNTSPEPASLPTGGTRFSTRSLLGQGGMGKVHVALDHQFGREVALKELGDGAMTTEGARRFVIEALVTGNLEHPGIPAVYERGAREGRPFYAMRKVEGRPMSEVIATLKTLPERLTMLPVIAQVANTLGFAHARGVVHRDIKPDNVLLGAHGAVVVVDWGIAKIRGLPDGGSAISGTSDPAAGATVHGSVLGTPAYMAPEQARGDVEAIDARTDVFALGAMLYHVLTGQPPFVGPTSMAMLAMAMTGERKALSDAAPEVPAALRDIVDRAMAFDPRARYANAEEFAKAIGAFMIEAVTQKPSLVARVVIGVASSLALLMLIVGAIALIGVLPGLASQGAASLVYTSLAVAGLVLSAVEWRTHGAHRLAPLTVALALATFLVGVSATFSGYVLVARYVGEQARMASPTLTADAAGGIWEASGAIAGGAMLSALQLVVAALVARRSSPPAKGA